MLRSYEAIYHQGRLYWLKDAPKETSLRVIVTVLEEAGIGDPSCKRRSPPPELAKTMCLRGDDESLLEPVIPEEEWDVLK